MDLPLKYNNYYILKVKQGAKSQYINVTVKPLLRQLRLDKNKFVYWVKYQYEDLPVPCVLGESVDEANRIIAKFWHKIPET